jgi:hypothetical protein
MSLITIFSAPKPFKNPHIATIQRNAIQSWMHLGPQVEVFLVGEEEGMQEAAAEYGLPILSPVERNDSGTPLVSSIFALARQASNSPYLAYVNADILLISDIIEATRQIAAALGSGRDTVNERGLSTEDGQERSTPFLLIGQRWDLDVDHLLDFPTDWEQHLCSEVHARGELHAPAGSDYFVFPRPAFTEIPSFAIGRAGWDNWMIYHARRQGWPLIDGTPSVMIVHQNHDYSHLPGGKPHYNLEESQQNMAMAGGLAHMYMVLDAEYQLANGRLRKPPLTLRRVLRIIERRLIPHGKGTQPLRGARGGLARRFRRLRRKLG